MPPGLLSKETNSCHKTSGFHKNSLQNRNNPNDNASLRLLKSCSYTRYYGVGYIEYSSTILLRLVRPFRFDFKLSQFSFLVYSILLTCIV